MYFLLPTGKALPAQHPLCESPPQARRALIHATRFSREVFEKSHYNINNEKTPLKTFIKNYVLFIAIGLLLACFEFSPEARAVVPPPYGGYPDGNTAEGQNALQ